VANPTQSPVVRIRLIHGKGTKLNIGSRCYWSYSGGTPTIAQLNALASSISTAWGAQLKALMSVNGGLTAVYVDDVYTTNGFTGSYVATVSGTRAGTDVSVNDCAILSFRIQTKYRGGKPKMFLPYGMVADQSSVTTWSSTFINAVDAAWPNFQGAVNGLTSGPITLGTQQHVSYYQGATQNPATSKWAPRNIPAARGTATVTPVLSAAATQIVGSQRRRLQA
jgi:hypothetical protein